MSSPTWAALDRPTRATLAGGVVVALLLAVVSAVTPASPARAADTGSLVWGVKASFRSYVAGPIAHGAIDLSGGTTRLGDGTFSFGQTGTTVKAGGPTGSTSFGGGVRFSGHDGQLDVRIASPRLVVTSATAAQLSADVTQAGSTSRVVMADLRNPSTSGGATTWKAFLTAAGSTVFALEGSEFYGAGTEMDPVKATVVPLAGPDPTETTATPEPTGTTPKPSPTSTRPTPRPSQTAGSGHGDGGGTDEAEPTKRRAGLLQWGVKTSFRSYITGPVARGTVAVSGGAAASGGTYRFGQRSSTATPPSAVGTTSYRGQVTFSGHSGLLAMTFADPQVRVVSPSSGTLSVQVGGRRLDIATLALRGGTRSTAGNAVAYSGVPASLTAAGSSLFSYDGSAFYAAGTAMDPVSFVVGSASTASASSGSSLVAGGSSGARPVSDVAAAPDTTDVAVAGCAVDDASLTWGFKESFRSYISGSIADGDWTTSGKASYTTPSFSFSAGRGTYDGAKGAGRLAWAGGIEFTGHDGALDTTVSNPVLRMTDPSSATLVLDVEGVSMDDAMAGRAKAVERKDVPFVTLDLAAAKVSKEGAKVVYEAVPTTLTTEGQAAFPNYDAGTAFDPVDLSFTAGQDCAAAAAAGQAADTDTAAVEQSAATSSDDGPGWLPWVGGGVIGALIVLVGLGGFLLGRRGTGASA